MKKFDFVSGKDFRDSLESDFEELSRCMNAQSWKAVHVLAGSIIEALLIDYLVSIDYQRKTSVDPLTIGLNQAIIICRKDGILTEKAEKLSTVVKSYRNLIHPGRKIRLGESVDNDSAMVAKALVDIVIKEVSSKRKDNCSPRVEQLLTKLERDPSIIPVIEHLLKDMQEPDLECFLSKTVQRYYELLFSEEGISKKVLESLESGFRIVFNKVSDEIKKKITSNFVAIIKEETETKVFVYETTFFRVDDLIYLPPDEIEFVLGHLFSRLLKGLTAPLMKVSGRIGLYLTMENVQGFIDEVVTKILWGSSDKIKETAWNYLLVIHSDTSKDINRAISNQLDVWIKDLGNEENVDVFAKIREMKTVFAVSAQP